MSPRLSLAAALTVVLMGTVPATAASAAAPRLQVTASGTGHAVTVRVKPSAGGRVQVAVQGPDQRVLARRTLSVGRGKVKTLKFATWSCAKCARVKVVGTLKAGTARPVQSTVAVDLTKRHTTTTTTTTTTTGAAKAPAPGPSSTTTSSTATTTTGAPAAAAQPAAPAVPSGTDAVPTGQRVTWAPPALTSPTTVAVSNTNRSLRLDNTKDYVVKMPATALTASGGLVITGGRNVVLIGGEIEIGWQGDVPPTNSRRGLYLQQQTGTIHIEGLYIHGSDLSEGINLDQRLGATVQIQNTRVENVHARDQVGFTDNHPDLIQSWAGPAELRVDRFSGSTDYQGFFFAPSQFSNVPPRLYDLRNIEIQASLRNGAPAAGVLLWQGSSFPMSLRNVSIAPDADKGMARSMYPNSAAWAGVTRATTAVTTTTVAGATYASPGYTAG